MIRLDDLTPSHFDTVLRIAAHQRMFRRGPMVDEYASFLGLKRETARTRLHALVRLRIAQGIHSELSQRCGGSQNTSEYRLTEQGWAMIGGEHA